MTNSGTADATAELEEIPCPLCGMRPFRIYETVLDRLSFKASGTENQPRENAYSIVVCSSCGFLYLNPRPIPGNLFRFYLAETYDPHRRRGGGIMGSLFRLARRFTVRWKAAKITKDLKSGALLDVGCGTGEFIAYMKDRGWNTLGLEIDRNAADVAKSSGCSVIVGDPAKVALPEKAFDLITLWHALEHLPDLNGAVSNVSAALKPGGRLAVALPNPGSFDARFYGSRWAAWDAPRHLYHFHPQDVEKLFSPKNFELMKCYALPLDPFYHSLLSETSWTTGMLNGLRALRGLLIGMISLFYGAKPERASSTLYLFRKM